MKKILFPLLIVLVGATNTTVFPRHGHGGGGAVVGALGGMAVGTMIGSAVAQGSHSDRAEREAVKAQEKTDQLRIDQEHQRVAQIERDADRRELERKLEEQRKVIEQQQQQQQSSSSPLVIALSILAGILLIAVSGLLLVLFRR